MESETDNTLAVIKIKFPEDIWIHEIFKKFYDIQMEIQYFLPYDLEKSIGNSVIEIRHWDIELIIQEIKDHNSVRDFNILEREENRVKFNVKTKDPYLLNAAIKCGVLIDFPVKVEEGWAYWNLISSRKGIDVLLSDFEEKGLQFELLKIGISHKELGDKKNQVSFEEQKILQKAIEEGFFDVPRKISLEELANQMGKSKSTLSVALRKIIKKKVMISE
jgi:predicted DNA binding protein